MLTTMIVTTIIVDSLLKHAPEHNGWRGARRVLLQNVVLFFFFYNNYQMSSDKSMKKMIYKLIQGLIKDVSLLIHKD